MSYANKTSSHFVGVLFNMLEALLWETRQSDCIFKNLSGEKVARSNLLN